MAVWLLHGYLINSEFSINKKDRLRVNWRCKNRSVCDRNWFWYAGTVGLDIVQWNGGITRLTSI